MVSTFAAEKTCNTCRESKSLDAFHKDASKADGHRYNCKSCAYARVKEWRVANLEHSQAYFRNWRAEHAEQERARARARYLADPEGHLAPLKAWIKANPERKKASRKSWVERNPEKVAAKSRRYNQAHPEKGREWTRRYKARKRALTVEPVDYLVVAARDRDICHICGEKVTAQTRSFDHVIPLAKGGPHRMSNIKVAHLLCNFKKGTR